MKDRLFDWPTVWRHVLLGAAPFLGILWIMEKKFGEGFVGVLVVILAACLPFIAVGWLGYQHWKHGKTIPSEKHSKEILAPKNTHG